MFTAGKYSVHLSSRVWRFSYRVPAHRLLLQLYYWEQINLKLAESQPIAFTMFWRCQLRWCSVTNRTQLDSKGSAVTNFFLTFRCAVAELRHDYGQTPHLENHQVPSAGVKRLHTCAIIQLCSNQQTGSYVDCHSNEYRIQQLQPVQSDRNSSVQTSERHQILCLQLIRVQICDGKQLMTISVENASRVQVKQDYEFRQLFMVRALSCFVLILTWCLCNAA